MRSLLWTVKTADDKTRESRSAPLPNRKRHPPLVVPGEWSKFEATDGIEGVGMALLHRRQVVPAEHEQAPRSEHSMARADCSVGLLAPREGVPEHPAERDGVEEPGLHVAIEVSNPSSDVVVSSVARIASLGNARGDDAPEPSPPN
jgi:hypothetical protein